MAFWNFLPLLFGGGGAAAAAGTAAAGAAATASLAPSLIGAGASLLGGALSARAEKKGIAAQNAYNHPTAIRQRAEEAGFNPLLFIGPGVGQQTAVGGSNYMGSAIANAGMQIADQMSKNQELARLEKLSAENKKLAEKVQTLTIRPKVGGVYAQRQAIPSLSAAVGGTNAGASQPYSNNGPRVAGDGRVDSGGANGLSPISTRDPVDPRREVEIKPVPSGPGVMAVENRWLPKMWFPTIDGDEPLDLLDVPSVIFALPQLGYHGGQYMTYGGGRESRPSLTRAEALRLKAQRAAERAAKRPKPDIVNRWNNSRPMFGGGF